MYRKFIPLAAVVAMMAGIALPASSMAADGDFVVVPAPGSQAPVPVPCFGCLEHPRFAPVAPQPPAGDVQFAMPAPLKHTMGETWAADE